MSIAAAPIIVKTVRLLAGSGYAVDYDRTTIPETYDRGHDHGAAVLDLWMRAIATHVDAAGVRRILDLACGTGRFAPSLASHFNATVIGLDPSMKMLRVAAGNCGGVPLVAAVGETLPLQSSSVDLIFMSMVFHHFRDAGAVAHECARILRPGGRVCLRTITADQISHYPYVPFFPATRTLLERRVPTQAATRAVFEAAGLRTVASTVIVQEIACDYAAYADKLAAGADTTLNSLSRDEFDAGLSAMRMTSTTRPIVEPIDFLVFAPADEAE